MKNAEVMIAAAAGALAGAALGLLFAPRCGKDTRAAIREYMRKCCRKGKECKPCRENDDEPVLEG